MVKTPGQTIFLTPSEAVFTLFSGDNLSSGDNISVVHMKFEGSMTSQIIGEGLLPGIANFFVGNDSSKWLTEIPTYNSVRYKDLYPGVILIFKGNEGRLKHELVLSPGADPAGIILSYSGQDNLSQTNDGSILIRTVAGKLTDSSPICYQDINGTRVLVEARYRVLDDHRIGFDVKKYNKEYPLVIDPALVYIQLTLVVTALTTGEA